MINQYWCSMYVWWTEIGVLICLRHLYRSTKVGNLKMDSSGIGFFFFLAKKHVLFLRYYARNIFYMDPDLALSL